MALFSNAARNVSQEAASIATELTQPLDFRGAALGQDLVSQAALDLSGALSFFDISPINPHEAQQGIDAAAGIRPAGLADYAASLNFMGIACPLDELARGSELAGTLKAA